MGRILEEIEVSVQKSGAQVLPFHCPHCGIFGWLFQANCDVTLTLAVVNEFKIEIQFFSHDANQKKKMENLFSFECCYVVHC